MKRQRMIAMYNWLGVFLYTGLIWYGSSRPTGAHEITDAVQRQVSAVVAWPSRWLTPGFIVQKIGHFAEYMLLGWLLHRAFRTMWAASPARRAGLAAFVTGLALAGLDEFHQAFVPGCEPNVRDVLIDAAGVATALLLRRHWQDVARREVNSTADDSRKG